MTKGQVHKLCDQARKNPGVDGKPKWEAISIADFKKAWLL
jgi:hypothetical protein